jgi:hypothetical protein
LGYLENICMIVSSSCASVMPSVGLSPSLPSLPPFPLSSSPAARLDFFFFEGSPSWSQADPTHVTQNHVSVSFSTLYLSSLQPLLQFLYTGITTHNRINHNTPPQASTMQTQNTHQQQVNDVGFRQPLQLSGGDGCGIHWFDGLGNLWGCQCHRNWGRCGDRFLQRCRTLFPSRSSLRYLWRLRLRRRFLLPNAKLMPKCKENTKDKRQHQHHHRTVAHLCWLGFWRGHGRWFGHNFR